MRSVQPRVSFIVLSICALEMCVWLTAASASVTMQQPTPTEQLASRWSSQLQTEPANSIEAEATSQDSSEAQAESLRHNNDHIAAEQDAYHRQPDIKQQPKMPNCAQAGKQQCEPSGLLDEQPQQKPKRGKETEEKKIFTDAAPFWGWLLCGLFVSSSLLWCIISLKTYRQLMGMAPNQVSSLIETQSIIKPTLVKLKDLRAVQTQVAAKLRSCNSMGGTELMSLTSDLTSWSNKDVCLDATEISVLIDARVAFLAPKKLTSNLTSRLAKLTSKLSKVAEQLCHPNECWALAKFLCKRRSKPKSESSRSPDEKICLQLLRKTSRSFAMVIEQLDEELSMPIAIFYLVLRALDTVEDDMSIPNERKKQLLLDFHNRLDKTPEESNQGIVGLGDAPEYVELLDKLAAVVRVTQACTNDQRAVISDITKRMAFGMESFVGVESIGTSEQYDLYCHYVAGLVGIGLSQMFGFSESEGKHMLTEHVSVLSNSMGLFLQKTNITRDYLEDVLEGRPWWPQQVWSRYSSSAIQLKQPEHHQAAVHCLNQMVTDALQHAPACLEYLGLLRNQSVFRFCAVPQVMAIATLDLLYNNHNVFEGVVKIRKGLALCLLDRTFSVDEVHRVFQEFAGRIKSKIIDSDPSAASTHAVIDRILQLTR